MKKLLAICALMVVTAGAFAQGTVVFANSSTTLITTNGGNGIAGAGAWRIGLFVGPQGSASNTLTLALLATNSPLAGRFSYPVSPAALPNGYAEGVPITFQVRAWLASGGADWASANAAGTYVGASPLVTVTPGGLSPAPALFGAGTPLTTGFSVAAIPEPSSIALGLLGLGAVALIRRRK